VTRRHQFVPIWIDHLERRVVLSHATPSNSTHGAALVQHAKPMSGASSTVASEVDQLFASFQQDFDQARATYFTSIQNQPNPSAATTYAFSAYTIQRVSLLSRQMLGILVPASHHPGGPQRVRPLVTSTIMGPKDQMPPGSLANALLASTPQPGTTAPTASLYTLAQDNAIASAEVGILNAVQRS
jgi:hypothetical protein